MARPSVFSVEDKFRLVLSVIAGEMTIAEAARRGEGVASSRSRTGSGSSWRAARPGLAEGGRPGSNPRERQLLEEIEELKAALGEAHVELRVWKKSAEYRLGPTRSSR